MKTKKPKLYKCREKAKGCFLEGHKWTGNIQMQGCCQNPNCVLSRTTKIREKAEKKKAKKAKVLDRALREAMKTRGQWIKEAQVEFNKFIRTRDQGKLCPCCGKPLGPVKFGGGYDCGHYRSVGSAPHLRFNENNAHGQRKICNRHGSGRAVDYRIGLIKRIGLKAVEALESDNVVRKWTIEELKEIKLYYRTKTKELLK